MKDLFFSFLKQQNAYDSFVANFSEDDGIEAYLEELHSEHQYYVTDAFIWGRSGEGSAYWGEISERWQELLEQQENEKND